MDFVLDPAEVRILGCLIEKDITTPEYYPMTMNALVAAANQKSNRDPVVNWDEGFISDSVDSLRDRKLVSVLTGGGNRVPKYSHRIQEVLNLGRREIAVLCELMLRGPQTLGELRDRAGRMHRFSDVEEVEGVLSKLAANSLAMQLNRQPGQKEARYAHLLSGEPANPATDSEAPAATRSSGGLEARVANLEAEMRELRAIVGRLQSELGI